MSFLHSTSLFTLSAIVTLIIQLSGFAAAYALQTETFYDIFGGLNFIIVGAGSYLLSQDSAKELEWGSSATLATMVFVLSRSWLLLFLAYRAHSRKGDARFDKIKGNFLYFLATWLMQGMWVYLISMPIIFINDSSADIGAEVSEAPSLSTLEWISLVGFAGSVAVEIVGDIQKTVWVEAGRQGGFCEVGLWAYSRHPNYFGEIFQWWCCWVFAFGSTTAGSGDGAIWVWALSAISPIFTMHILLNVTATGVWNAEGKNLKRYYTNPECSERYKQYRNNTSNLIPMIGYGSIPMPIKRTLLFEWERFEYREAEDDVKRE